MSKTYQPCEVRLEFGDGEYLFRLPYKMLAELQRKLDAPIGAIYTRVISGQYRAEDLVEVVRCGLIGGGMSLELAEDERVSPKRANELIDTYCDQWPLEVWHTHAVAVLLACMHGYEAEDEKKPLAAGATDGSTSPQPTAPASSTTSRPAKSTTSRSGKAKRRSAKPPAS